MQKSVEDFWSILGRYRACLYTSLCWKTVFMMRNPLLQQNCNKYLPFSFSPVTPCFPIETFHASVSVPTCELKFPSWTADSVGHTWRRASLALSTKAWYSPVALEIYICTKHNVQSNTLSFNMPTCNPKYTSLTIGIFRESPHLLEQTC